MDTKTPHYFLSYFGVSLQMATWATALLGPLLCIYVLLSTKYWILSVLYLIWIFYDRNTGENGGRNSKFLENSGLGDWTRSYFPMRVIKTSELDPSKNYLLCYHPHGIFSIGVHGMFGLADKSIFPGIQFKTLTLNTNFYVPVLRDLMLSSNLCSVSRRNISLLLSKPSGGIGAVIVPGGAREALFSHPGSEVVYLNQRKGFVKVAIENGSPLVPVYAFGENNLYSQPFNPIGSIIRKIQEKTIDVLGMVPLFVWGNGVLPRRTPVTAVVGKPIQLEQMNQPTAEYVDKIHAQYIAALTDLYNTYRENYGNPKIDLQIV